MLVKICGFRDSVGVKQALAAGADFVGLLVGVRDSPHDISAEKAREIIAALAPEARKEIVLLTWLAGGKQLLQLVAKTGAKSLQLVKAVSKKTLADLGAKGIVLFKTINVGEQRRTIAEAREYASLVDFLVLDTRVGRQRGGTGRKHDWSVSKSVVEVVGKPVFLAGGLNAKNVSKAIAAVSPAGVDASTGVEENGRKTFGKMRAFVKACRKANK